jgi:hypothetical protein
MVRRVPRRQFIEDLRQSPAGLGDRVHPATAAGPTYHAMNQPIALELTKLFRQHLR